MPGATIEPPAGAGFGDPLTVVVVADRSTTWIIVPLLLFWQCRLWLATARGFMTDDPIIYAAKDWVSVLVGIALITTMVVNFAMS